MSESMSWHHSAPPRSTSRGSGNSFNKFLIIDGFAIAYLVALGLTFKSGPSANHSTFLWLGLVFSLLCIYTFFYAGSRHILFGSVFSYGQLLFVASPALLIGVGQTDLRTDLRASVALLFLSLFFLIQLMVLAISQPVPKVALRHFEVDGSFQIMALGLSMLTFATSYVWGESELASQVGTLSLVAIVLSSLVSLTRPTFLQSIPHLACLIAITALYALYQFSGFGRLVLASYLLSVVVVFSWVVSSHLPKVLTVLATVPGLVILSLNRIAFLKEEQGRQIGADESIGSVLGPFQSGAYILQSSLDGTITATFGQSLFSSLFFWVPRSLWSDKPDGFGRAIVPVTQPHLIATTEYSDAAPYLAELVWDFGVLGVALCPIVVIAIAFSDRMIESQILSKGRGEAPLSFVLLFVFLACLVSMFLNYIWGGSFAYLSRTAAPAVMLLFLYWVVATRVKRRAEQSDYSEPKNFPEMIGK